PFPTRRSSDLVRGARRAGAPGGGRGAAGAGPARRRGRAAVTWPEIAGGLAGVAVTLGAIGTAMGWGYRRLREWIQRTAAAAERAADAVATSNGHTAGELVEQVARDVSVLRQRADQNQEIALEARALAREANARLDAHLAGHTGG